MQIIFISPSGRNILAFRLQGWKLWLGVCMIGLVLVASARAGVALSTSEGSWIDRVVGWWETSRTDTMARELGSLKAQIDLLESTVSAMEGDAAPGVQQPAAKPTVTQRPPRKEELELRLEKISSTLNGVNLSRQRKLESMATGAEASPIDAEISSHFGIRTDPFDGSPAFHRGVDFHAPIGTAVFAVADGVVRSIGTVSGYGNLVEIEHSARLMTRYAHLDGIEVTTGMPLRAGQRIARVGSTGRSTGPHLHFELILDGKPVNPTPYLAHIDEPRKQAETTPTRPARSL
jgi:murein DD-endopeptidase MepM/ murein hydrolase activator NlpD